MNIPAAEKTIQKLFASAASNCHDWWPCFWPLEETEDVRKEGALRMWKAALIRCIISWFGRICFPHVQRIVSLNTACPHEGHWWISEVLNSMSSTLAMSWAAWVDSWLNSMLSFTGSSRIQIFFEPTLIRSIIWLFASPLGNVLVVTSTSPVWISSIVVTDCSQLPGLQGCVSNRLELQVSPRFSAFVTKKLGTSVCQKWNAAAGIANSCSTLPCAVALEFQVVRKSTRSPPSDATRSMQSPGIVA